MTSTKKNIYNTNREFQNWLAELKKKCREFNTPSNKKNNENINEEFGNWLEELKKKCWEFAELQNIIWDDVVAMDATNISHLQSVAHSLMALKIKVDEGGFDVDPLPPIVKFIINLKK